MFFVEFAIFVSVIIVSIKKTGSLGLVSLLGLAIYVFIFNISPTPPPLQIAMLIFSIFLASSSLETAGGFDYMGNIAGKLISRYPKMITIIAPMVSYFFVLMCGSGYVVAAILPMIYKISLRSGIRPERPLTASVIAANKASLSSPISSPTLATISIFTPQGISIKTIFGVLITSTFFAALSGAISMYNKGEDIKLDDFIKELDDKDDLLTKSFNMRTKIAVLGFLLAVLTIATLGIFENLRPQVVCNGVCRPLDLTSMIIILMIALSALITLFCKVNPSNIFSNKTFSIGGNIVTSIFGISWLASTFIQTNKMLITSFVSTVVADHLWVFGVFVIILSMFIVSHTAAILTLFPLGSALGIAPLSLIALIPAVDSVFMFPSYPSIQVVLGLDKTGSTHVGKYIINHSFIRPGIVALVVDLMMSHLLVYFFFS